MKLRDEEILSRIRQGDEKVLDQLYIDNYDTIVRLIRKKGGTEDQAKDIFQDCLIVFWQKVIKDELTLTAKISTYLYGVSTNLWLKEFNKNVRMVYVEKEQAVDCKDDLNERQQIIRGCIEELGDVCRQILQYYYFDGFSMKDISEKLNFANTDTTKTKKYKCKRRLDQLVKERYNIGDFLD